MSAQYVYIPFKTALGCATVGFYNPEGEWMPESDHANNEAAAQRVNYLNGGQPDSTLRTALLELCERWLKIEQDCERHLREDKLSPASESRWLTKQQATGYCRVELQAALKLPAQKGDA